MRQLQMIDSDSYELFVGIANSKQNPQKKILDGLKPLLKNVFDQYHYNFERILYYTSPTFEDEECKSLLHCYNSPTAKLNELKALIRKNAIVILKGKICPYCLMDIANTIDHYLPKQEYPEFSVLADNLIPACSFCNEKKNDAWKNAKGDERGFLHFYFDLIPTKTFLKAELDYRKGGVPVMVYTIDDIALSPQLANIVIFHFERLDLLNRYSEHFIEVINDIIDYREEMDECKLSIEETLKYMKRHSKQLKKRLGNNYWKALAFDAIIENRHFLDDYINGEEFKLI